MKINVNELRNKLDMLISDYEFEYDEEKGLVKIVKFELLSSLMNKSIAYWLSLKDIYVNRLNDILYEYKIDYIICIADFTTGMTLLSSANGLVLSDYFGVD
jgi:hypothetical protein